MNVIVKKRKKMKTKKSKMIKAVAGILTGPITYKMAKKKKMKMEDIAPFFGAAGLAYSKMKKRKSGSSKKGEMKEELGFNGGGIAIKGTKFKGVF
jgi:hypothetical protein|tara:strand:+ start:1377 stop:1661 length:285 start_codon:yes stop_codon:yes gene_type:complete